MKVLHAAETIKGGVATVINSLVDYQTEHNSITKVICIAPSDQIDSLIEKESLNVYQFKRNGRNLLGMISFFITFLRSILKEKPDVVHLHSSFAGLLGRMALILSGRLHKTKVIYCPHAFGFLMQTSPIKKRIYGIVELCLANFTDKVICVSQSEYDSAIKNGFKNEKLVIIYNGVQVKFKSNTFTANNKTHYKLLFVGRFDYQKGIDILYKAIELLAKENSNIFYQFTLIGEAVNSDVKIQFNDSKNIVINKLGWLKSHQLEEQYLNHDAIIIPSRWEGFAMVPLEAMSYGLPIIGSKIEAFKELDNPIENYITFFENSKNLSEILINIHKVNLEKHSRLSNKHFKENFSAEKMNSNTYNLYK